MYRVNIDGACEPVNPGGTASYGLVIKRNGKTILKKSGIVGKGEAMSNNVAEYCGLLAFLEWYSKTGRNEKAVVCSDSQLLIHQMQGKWKAKKGLYLAYCQKACSIIREKQWLNLIEFNWVPREQNSEADRLSVEALKSGSN